MNGNIQYHIVWCTKYRRKIIVNNFEEDLKSILISICDDNGWEIIELETMPDHIHIFLKSDMRSSPHKVISQLKGRSSFELRQKYGWLKTRLPCLWTRSYYIDSIGNANSETIKKYIINQKGK